MVGLQLVASSPATGSSSVRAPGRPFSHTDFRRPDFFPILPWDPLHGWDSKASDWETNGLESIAECHFNFAGFVEAKDLPKCRRLGLGAILLPSGDDILPLNYQRAWKSLNDQEIDRRIKRLVKAGGANPALKGYFIMDEPSVTDFPALAKAVAAVKKYAPGKLAYINLFPDYATLGAPDISQLGTSNYIDYLERFVSEVKPQVLSYDNYMVQYSDDFKRSELAGKYLRNLVQIRRVGLEHGLPCLQIVAANQLRPGHTIPSPANLSLQAYTTLAAGFRGVTWYTYYARGYSYAAIDRSGHRTLTWAYLSQVNRQVATLAPVMSRLSSTGIYFTDRASAEGLPRLPGRLVQKLESGAPFMAGEFSSSEGEEYVMVVNLSLERSANFTLTTTAEKTLQEVSASDGYLRAFAPGKDGAWLPPGQGLLLKLNKP